MSNEERGVTSILLFQAKDEDTMAKIGTTMMQMAHLGGGILIQLNPGALPNGWIDEQIEVERKRLIAKGRLIPKN